MKKLMFVCLLFVSTLSHAYEKPQNPDRFPSIGLGYSNSRVSGDVGVSFTDGTFEKGTEKWKSDSILTDFRLPVSNSATLNVSYEMINGEKSNNLIDVGHNFTNLDGYKATVGVRLYLNK